MLATLAKLVAPGLKVGQLRYRPPLWHPDFPLVIFWSEKAGCTTTVKWFFHQIGLLEDAQRHSPWIHEYENKVFKAQPGYLRDCHAALLKGRPVVKMVRDTAARAYSGYLELCHPRVLNSPPWQKLRRQALTHVSGSETTGLEFGFSFLDFIGWLESVDMEKINGHLRPQLTDYEQYLEVEALPIENARESLLALERRHGLKPHTGLEARIFESGHHNAKRIDLQGRALERLLGLSVPIRRPKDFELPIVDTRRLLGTETGARLARLFACDYKAYPQYALPGLGDLETPKPLLRAAN